MSAQDHERWSPGLRQKLVGEPPQNELHVARFRGERPTVVAVLHDIRLTARVTVSDWEFAPGSVRKMVSVRREVELFQGSDRVFDGHDLTRQDVTELGWLFAYLAGVSILQVEGLLDAVDELFFGEDFFGVEGSGALDRPERWPGGVRERVTSDELAAREDDGGGA